MDDAVLEIEMTRDAVLEKSRNGRGRARNDMGWTWLHWMCHFERSEKSWGLQLTHGRRIPPKDPEALRAISSFHILFRREKLAVAKRSV